MVQGACLIDGTILFDSRLTLHRKECIAKNNTCSQHHKTIIKQQQYGTLWFAFCMYSEQKCCKC